MAISIARRSTLDPEAMLLIGHLFTTKSQTTSCQCHRRSDIGRGPIAFATRDGRAVMQDDAIMPLSSEKEARAWADEVD